MNRSRQPNDSSRLHPMSVPMAMPTYNSRSLTPFVELEVNEHPQDTEQPTQRQRSRRGRRNSLSWYRAASVHFADQEDEIPSPTSNDLRYARKGSESTINDSSARRPSQSTLNDRYVRKGSHATLCSARLGRANSSASRAGRPLSWASQYLNDAFEATWEAQGWGGTNIPAHHNSGVRPLSSVDPIEEAPDSRRSWNDVDEEKTVATEQVAAQTKVLSGPRMWLVMFALCVTSLLVALEGTVTSTALPSITQALGGGQSFIWVSTGYFLTSTVFQPLYGQMANILGRRPLILFAVSSFILGSGISGGANTIGILILGRVIQGVGGGGINMLVNLIVCDLVPLRERGRYMAVVFSAISVGTSLGPFLGGVLVQTTTWRWVFFLNLPVGGASLVMLFFFLKLGSPKNGSVKEKLTTIDYGGNVIFILGVSLILVALAYGGTSWPWASYQTIATLLFGVYSLVVFAFYEESNYCAEPMIPMRLFRNRTASSAFAITFIHSMLTMLVIYFLPVYLQGVLLSSPTRSGVQMLPTVIVLVPFSTVSGALLSKFGRYKPFHFGGFAFLVLGLGLFLLLKPNSSDVVWIMSQFVTAAGSGFVLSTLLPAAQAEFSDKDTASVTATWAFIRQFGVVWGVSVPSAIFNARFQQLLPRISDLSVQSQLTNGAAYEHATRDFVGSFTGTMRDQIVSVYSDSLQIVWIFATAIAGLGFLLVFLEREVMLRTELETDFGFEEERK